MRIVSLIKNDRGVTSVLFAFMGSILVLLTLAGFDLMRYQVVYARVQAALDGAVLAAGRRLDSDTMKEDIESFFWANMDPGLFSLAVDAVPEPTYQSTSDGETVSITLTGKVPLLLSGLIDAAALPFTITTTARKEMSDLELVLAMDNTGSMADSVSGGSGWGGGGWGGGGWGGGDQPESKLEAMKTAAGSLVTALMGDTTTTSQAGVYIGVVPFTTTVKTPGYTSWLKAPANAVAQKTDQYGNKIYVGPNYNRLPVVEDFNPDTHWEGCLMEDDITDLAVNPTSKLDVFYMPMKEVCLESNGSTCKTSAERPFLTQDTCITAPISFLNADADKARDAIDAMKADGGTAVVTGLLWGWRMLSPTWSQDHSWEDQTSVGGGEGGSTGEGSETGGVGSHNSSSVSLPQPYEPYRVKAVVLLTDGENSYNLSSTYATALGFGPSGTQLDTALTNTCTAAKNEGITIYSITFGPEATGTIEDIMEGCATSPAYYFHAPSNEELQTTFSHIAGSLTRLSIIK